MQFDDDRVDTSKIDDLRGSGGNSGGGMFPTGGGGGGMGGMGSAATVGILASMFKGKGGCLPIVLILAVMLLGGGLFGGQALLGGDDTAQQATPTTGATSLSQKCNQPGAIQQYPDCLLAKAFNETDEVWSQEFARLGQDYSSPRLTFFSNKVNTACGPATTAVGPFYCPGDNRIYFDLGFAKDLQQLGVQGDYANVYIMAHEFGHHLQNITGIEAKVRQLQAKNKRNANKYGVAMELQADCMAGVWGRMANDRGNLSVTPEELKDAQNAAAAVGDDRIQAGAGQRINPDTWTHGSAKQREQWYMTGWNSGDINRCNTFANLS